MKKNILLEIPAAFAAGLLFAACRGFEPTPADLPPTAAQFTSTSAPSPFSRHSPSPARTPSPQASYCDDVNPEPGLFRYASKLGFTIGAYVTLERIRSDQRYCEVMLHDFNLVHMEEFSHPDFWGDRPGEYHFEVTDPMVEYAEARGWRVRASHLVWGWAPFLPDWLKNGNFSKEEYERILELHVKTIMGRYKGRVQEWSIANEVVDRDPSLGWEVADEQLDFWAEKIGPGYVKKAFQWAREADSQAVLILNGNYLGSGWAPFVTEAALDKTLEIVRDLNGGNDILVDGVGIQMHTGSPASPTVADLLRTMNPFKELGARIFITEMDVNLHSREGTLEERYAYQAKVYRNALTACIRSGICASFDTMNIEDSESVIEMSCPQWGPDACPDHADGDPLLFDGNLNPKPAYSAVRDVLMNGGSYGTNLALHKPAAASSTQLLENSQSLPPGFAVDGDESTRWSSGFSDPQWLRVDLGGACRIERIVLNWENAYGKDYEIRVSADGTAWEVLYSRTGSTGYYDTFTVSGTGRYLMMYGLKRGSDYGYSLWEFEVYGSLL